MLADCYREAFQHLTALHPEEAVTPRLVHGFPRLTQACGEAPAGSRYGHAWIELEVFVEGMPGAVVVCVNIDPEASIPMEPFYAVGEIDERWVRRYSLDQALRMARDRAHYGPWHVGPPDTYLPD